MKIERDEIIESIRQRLRTHREYLQRKLGIEWPDDVQAHSTSALSEQFPDLNAATLDEFRQIELALQKIREAEYGFCTRCGNEITGERLEVIPFAKLCIHCQLED